MRRALLAALLCLLALFGAPSFAEETAQERLIDSMDLAPWQEQTPEISLHELISRLSRGDLTIDGEQLLETLRTAFFRELRFSLPLLLRACAVSVLTAVLGRLTGAGLDGGAAKVSTLVLFLCAALPLGADFMRLVEKGGQCVSRLDSLAQAILPAMLALLAALGGEATVTAMQPMVLACGAFCTSLIQNLLLPVVRLAALLVLVGAMTGEDRFSGLVGCFRSFCHWALGACFTAFLGLLTVKGLGGGAIDGVSVRTAKYTVDRLVPVVGGLFKDSVETLAGCALVVKNAVGIAGLLSLLLCLLAPAASILAVLTGYRLCAALLQPLGPNRLISALQGFAAALSTLLLCLLVAAAVFFVFVTVLMMSGIQW